MTAPRPRLPNLPRPSWRWARGVAVGLLVASAMSAALRAIDDPYWSTAAIMALYPLCIAAAAAVPLWLIAWLAPPLPKGLVVPAAALACALPPVIREALSPLPEWASIAIPLSIVALAGGLGGLAFWAFSETGRAGRGPRIAFWASFAAVVLPVAFWQAGWRVSTRTRAWETASPGECRLMAEAIQEMKFDALPDHPPLIGRRATGGPCDWPALGLPLKRLTWAEFRAAAGDDLRGRYIEHIDVSRPNYSLLRLRAVVEVAHAYGSLGGDGFRCAFRRGVAGWELVSCDRAWIA